MEWTFDGGPPPVPRAVSAARRRLQGAWLGTVGLQGKVRGPHDEEARRVFLADHQLG
jgi:hypothetical protein